MCFSGARFWTFAGTSDTATLTKLAQFAKKGTETIDSSSDASATQYNSALEALADSLFDDTLVWEAWVS